MTIANPNFVDAVSQRQIMPAKELYRFQTQDADHYQLLLHLIHNGLMKPPEACRLWADCLGIAWLDLRDTLFQPDIVAKLPQEQAKTHSAIPLYQLGDHVSVAMTDPKNPALTASLAKIIGVPVSPVFSLEENILDTIEIQYHSVDELKGLANRMDAEAIPLKKTISQAELEELAGEQSVVAFSRSLLLLGVKEDASDIHIEPFEDYILIRFRIDGILHERLRLAVEIWPPLLSRLKILATMDITERRRPQDGRLSLALANRSIAFRVSSVPTVYGEKLVLRLLGQIQKRNVPQLENLYLSQKIYTWAIQLLNTPSGAFFITGPTGCGKTTTLFSALQRINTPDKNIMTIEDPVEYRLHGISQIQVNAEIGVTFAKVLRALLRQDPDVILIGEIRDLETAKIATEAALTGHLVFATLHTTDAIQAVTRLVEIGVEPFLVGPSLIGIMSQRLARKLCMVCREPYQPTPEMMDDLFIWDGKQEVTFHRAKGCPRCKFTGYSGRLPLHEMVLVNEPLRKLVMANAPINEIRSLALASGYQTMRYDGIKKVLRGLTSMEEVNRVAPMA